MDTKMPLFQGGKSFRYERKCNHEAQLAGVKRLLKLIKMLGYKTINPRRLMQHRFILKTSDWIRTEFFWYVSWVKRVVGTPKAKKGELTKPFQTWKKLNTKLKHLMYLLN